MIYQIKFIIPIFPVSPFVSTKNVVGVLASPFSNPAPNALTNESDFGATSTYTNDIILFYSNIEITLKGDFSTGFPSNSTMTEWFPTFDGAYVHCNLFGVIWSTLTGLAIPPSLFCNNIIFLNYIYVYLDQLLSVWHLMY